MERLWSALIGFEQTPLQNAPVTRDGTQLCDLWNFAQNFDTLLW